jgi:hypothetical protein
VATVAGYATYKPDVDDDSVDLGIAARGRIGQMFSPRLELQLKCTSAAVLADEHLAFPLKRKNYDDLRVEETAVPRLLVVVRVPEEELAWLAQAEDEMILRHCGYWLALRGRPETTNETSVTVHLPRNQLLTVNALQALTRRAGAREAL